MTYLDFLEEIASMHKQSETPEQLKQTVLEQGSQMQKSVKLDLPKNCMVSPEHKAAREQLSQQMRDKLATMAINATSVPHVHLMRRGAFDRMINAVAVYYISKKQPEQVTRFQQLFAETESDTKRLEQLMKDGRKTKEQAQLALNEEKKDLAYKRGEMLGELMQPFFHLREQDLQNLSNEDIVERFEELHLFHTLAMHAEKFPTDAIHFTDAQKQKLSEWKQMLCFTGKVDLEAQLMANPYYAEIDYQALSQSMNMPSLMEMIAQYTEQCKTLDKSDQIDSDDKSDQIDSEDPFYALPSYINATSSWELQRQGIELDHLKQQLCAQGANAQAHEWKISDKSGRKAIIDDIFEGKPLYVQSDEKNWEITLDPTGTDKHPVITPPETLLEKFNQDYAAQTDGLKNALKGAELWRRGSKEYKDIKKNLEELTQFGQLGEHPTVYQCEQLRQHLQSLQESSEKYLATKGDTGRNEREQKRMDAAKQVKEFASRKLQQLSCLTTGLEAKQAQRNQSGPEAAAFEQSASSRRVQQDNIGRALDAKRADPEVIKQKAQEFCNLSLPGKESQLILSDLKQQLQGDGLNVTVKFTQSPEGKLQGESFKWAKEVMEGMTALALIEQQLQKRKDTKPIEPGQPLFKGGAAELMNSVRNHPVFQQAIKDLSPQRFGNFIAGDGARKLGQQMLDTARQHKGQANSPSQPTQQQHPLRQSSPPQHKQSGPAR